ncbi:unnamed protein product [Owenia fusiformis]|uniref:Uncharacterized protein n=1 Tax=Owenia fusiformis TaxID=6347 RepID=A0A8J1XIZ5_OWEFU|nr:unnamed protein product [Owenia fusiformis]
MCHKYLFRNVTPPSPEDCLHNHNNSDEVDRLLFQLDAMKTVEFSLLGIGAIIICVFGFVTNIMSLIVLSRKELKSTSFTYLTAICSIDLGVLLVTTFMIGLSTVFAPPTKYGLLLDGTILPYLYPYIRPLYLMFTTASIWLVTALTIDRYITICYALKSSYICTTVKARIIIIFVCVFALLYNIPTFFEYQARTVQVAYVEKGFIIYKLTWFGLQKAFRLCYHSWVYIIAIWALPFVIMIIMNGLLARTVHKARKKSKEMGCIQPRGQDVTIMMVVMVTVFFICQCPNMVCHLLYVLDVEVFHSSEFQKFAAISSLLVLFNSAINIFIYAGFGRKFRTEFMEIFCKCRREMEDTANMATTSENKMLSSGKFPWQKKASDRSTDSTSDLITTKF